MDIKLKNIDNKKLSYILYTLIIIFTAVAFLSFIEVKSNIRFVNNKTIYTETDLKYQIDDYTAKVIDFVHYYKNEAYVKDKANITQNDIDICKNEIRDKIEAEYEEYRNKQYSYASFNESSAEKQDEILEKGKKEIEAKYTMSDEAFQKYVLDRKLSSYNKLKNELNSYVNLKFMAHDKSNNSWIGKKQENTSSIQNYSKYFVENNIDGSGRYSTKLYLDGKEVTNGKLKEQVLSYNYNYESHYYDNLSSIDMNNISLYIWIPNNLQSGDAIYNSYKDINNNVRRVFAVAIVFVVSVAIMVILVKIYKKNNCRSQLIEEINKKVKKYPIEYKLGVGIIAIVAWRMTYYRTYYNLGYINLLNVSNLIGIGVVLALIYLIANILYLDYKDGDLFKNNITLKVWIALQEIMQKGSLFRTILICMGIYAGVGLGLLAIAFLSGGFLFPICLIAGLIITVALVILGIKKLYYLDRIMLGARDGAEGRLTYKIDEKGKGQFRELAHNINNIKEGLKESINKEVKSEKMKTELITNVSHDLKTPLTSIINYIDLLKRENIQPEEARDYVNILDKKSQRLKILIEDLFEASKAASGAMELNVDRLDIIQLLRQALGENDEKLADNNLDLRVNIPDEKIYINGDGKRLYRVFENLINNISKYSLNNTRVYIDVIKAQDEVKIIMRNISSYELNFNTDEITERFKRGDEARTTEGSGLGLAITKSIIELHHGEFKVEVDGDLFKSIITLKI